MAPAATAPVRIPRAEAPLPTALPGQPAPARANLGPLTTAFAFPSHCSRVAVSGTLAVRGQTCRVRDAKPTAEDDTGCWPRATAYPSAAASASSLQGLGFYSPGVMCPQGYATACSAAIATPGAPPPKVTGAPVPQFGFQFPLVAGETAVGCCPTGYTCAMNGGAQACHQVATNTKIDAMTCNNGVAIVDVNTLQVPFTSEGTPVQTLNIWAPLVQIHHQASDLPPTSTPTPTPTPSSSSAIVTSSAVSSSSNAQSSSASSSQSSSSVQNSSVSSVPSSSSSSATSVVISSGGKSTVLSTSSISGSSAGGASQSTAMTAPSGSSSSVSSSAGSSISVSGSVSGTSSAAITTGSASVSLSGSTIMSSILSSLPSSYSGATALPTFVAGGGVGAGPGAGSSSGAGAGAGAGAGSGSNGISSASPTIPTSAPSASASAAPEPAPALSTGGKVGIAFVPIAAAAMLITYLLYRKQKQGKDKSIEEPEHTEKTPPPEFLPPLDLTENSPYNEDAMANGGLQYIASDDINPEYMARSVNKDSVGMFNVANVNTYSVSMAKNGPGPMVPEPVAFAAAAVPRTTGRAEEEAMHYYGDERDMQIPDTPSSSWPNVVAGHARTASRCTDERSIDSPIDGTSPFRLKRGDSGKDKHGSNPSSPLSFGCAASSPLARSGSPGSSDDSRSGSAASSYDTRNDSASSSYGSSQPSPKGSEFEFNGLKRENSFSRPRPARPKTGASSIYTDVSRDTRVLSWNDGDSPMPPMPSPSRLETVMESESPHPMRKDNEQKHDSIEAAVAAIAAGKITPPSQAQIKSI
ncbi:unnamed protein product [Periconia digitata]|uniref:Uncharacterized protein n=1 Tax=Periconia digitata TaxID=1303443 RepID=A0A9W4UFV4_9PLEO|nr:unnamed protein product [Periconia digitata]